ncbi:hypothetical protein CO046_03595 [Candidatus Peregrinibacteria bacterium CG_4_9_14_0_2_um_filter_53_11]|nr:MAG: hypothetical protein CO046_03595 [Candidatus Peregrinibacteria bacterium CG_4_9_14_0_2_um_filter_53_11]
MVAAVLVCSEANLLFFWPMPRRLIPIVFLTFVNTIGFSILIPVLPFVVERYGSSPFMYGVLLSAYSLCQFLAAPLIGSLSDKFGRRPTLLLSQLGTFLSWLIFGAAYFIPENVSASFTAFSLPLVVIAFSRVIDGITGGNISVTNAYVADITPPEQRTRRFGLLGAVMGFGFVVGPALGGYTASFSIGYLGTVIAAAVISLITLVVTYFYLTESLTHDELNHKLNIHLLKELNIFAKLRQFTGNTFTKQLFIRRIFFALAFAAFTSTFALYAKDILELDAKRLGFLLLFIGLFSILNQSMIAHRVAKRLGDYPTFNLGQFVLMLSIAGLALRPGLIGFIVLMYLTNLGMSLSMPTFKSLLTGTVDKSRQGQITGLDESLLAGSNGVAPLIAGALYGVWSAHAFGVFSILLLLPLLYFFPYNRPDDTV